MSSSQPQQDPVADARLAAASSVWAYLPWLPLYPLRSNALAVQAMVAIFVAVGSKSLMGIPLLAITAIWTLQYLMQVIQRSANGQATPPTMGGDVVFLDGWRTARALIAPGLLLTALGAAEGVGHGTATRLLLLLAAVAAPAYLFTLAFEDALPRALNPLVWLQLALGFGASYLLSCGLFVLAVWLPQTLAHTVPIWALAAAAIYLAILSAHALGVSAALRREALDLPVRIRKPAEVAAEQELDRRIDLLMLRLEAHLRANDAGGAVAALALEVPQEQRRRLHEILFERLLLRGPPGLIQAEGQYLIEALLEERRAARALDIFEVCDNLQSGFLPDDPARVWALAQAARDAGRDHVLETLVQRGAQTWPQHPVAARLLFLYVCDLSERRGEDARARQLLPRLLADTTHPDHAQFLAFARALERIGAAAGRSIAPGGAPAETQTS